MKIGALEQHAMDALAREWAAKIEYLRANADKAHAAQRGQYFEYIDSLQARQQRGLHVILQGRLP